MCAQEKWKEKHKQELQALKVNNTILSFGEQLCTGELEKQGTGNSTGTQGAHN